jgi:hypothetical protein
LILFRGGCGVEEDKPTVSVVPDTKIPLAVFGSEPVAANLLQQTRWRDGVTCACCRSDPAQALGEDDTDPEADPIVFGFFR